MTKGVPPPAIPANAPQVGETYRHYKGDSYKVVGLALHSNDDEWMVIYEPLYEADADLFTRPLKDWNEVVEWQGQKKVRFEKI